MVLSCCLVLAVVADDPFADDVRPFLERHCVECHAGDEAQAGLDLSVFDERTSLSGHAETFELVRDVLFHGEMPPEDRPRPGADDVRAVVRFLEEEFALDAPATDATAERVPLRRLNRFEYENTIRDLFGYDYRADEHFPRDQVSEGFDNNADALAMPDVLFEKFLFAAEHIANNVVTFADPDNPPAVLVEAAQLSSEQFDVVNGVRSMFTNGVVSAKVRLRSPGEYRVRIVATAAQAGADKARMDLRLGGRRQQRFVVDVERPELETFEHFLTLEAGDHEFGAAFVNDYYRPNDPDPSNRDRNLYVQSIELAGPVGTFTPSRFQERLKAEHPDAREAVKALAERVYRRPVAGREVRALLELSQQSEPWEERVRSALVALLASPHFLFKVERDRGAPGETSSLTDWELGTRLSYFLWCSTPDAELARACEAGELQDRDGILRQVRRMLRDPRASTLASNFAAQWLKFRNLDDVNPDRERFEAWDDDLREAMREETRLFFEAILREDRPVSELLDADFTFLNERLAEHYGIGGVRGEALRRVPIPLDQRDRRGGILTHASLLTVNSNPTRTSPVLRGKWILETLLGTPPPAPPPGVDDLPQDGGVEPTASLRERLEQHREDKSCAVCHEKMDALGFGLEHYDAIGKWRTRDGRFEIDAEAELPDGTKIRGGAGLRDHVLEGGELPSTLARALAVYALGRGLGRAEEAALERLAATFSPDVTIRELVEGLCTLDLFRTRTAAGVQK